MSLNFIDIASWQAGIDLKAVFLQNPIDGVIVKATQGTDYVNPFCDGWVQWLIQHGKPWGFYHYLSGLENTGAEEAEFFYKHCLNYFGHGVALCDLEANAVNRGPEYTKQFLDRLYELSGVRAMFYAQQSVVQSFGAGSDGIVANGHKLWLAQYASATDIVYGFKEKPWQKGSVAPWPSITMHQYTSHGRLTGYLGDLDLDIFYGTTEDWAALAGKEKPEPKPEPTEDWLDDWIEYLEDEKQRIQAKIDELKARR